MRRSGNPTSSRDVKPALHVSLTKRDVARWCRCGLSVTGPFVGRCLTSLTMLPFPHPAHRTGRADLPHPALEEKTHAIAVAIACDAVCNFWKQLGSCQARSPISLSVVASCVRLQLRSLPSTGITRLPRYYEPVRLPRQPGLSLTGVQLDYGHPLPGVSRVANDLPCANMPSPLPRWDRSGIESLP